MISEDRRYSAEHEWAKLDPDGTAVIGITQYAQEQLGDVVFLELPQVGAQLRQSEKMGEIESVKAVSDLYTPLSGEVIAINDDAVQNPERVNESPYEAGWLLRLRPTDPAEMDQLLTAQAYEEFLAAQE